MTYCYTLNKNDLKKLKIPISKNNKHTTFYIEQNGWDCSFTNIYELEVNFLGEFKGDCIYKASNLTESQKDYIIKKCKCEEI